MERFVNNNPIVCAIVGFFGIYFESTLGFLLALFAGFIFNVLAGLRADSVSFQHWHLCNFKGHKFKDSLIEIFLIILITYFTKGLIDSIEKDDVIFKIIGIQKASVYVVEFFLSIAVYFYLTNGLKNLTLAYPRMKWIKVILSILRMEFRKRMPDSIVKSIDEVENDK